MSLTKTETLLAEGFAPVARMILTGDGIKLNGNVPKVSGVYAFVVDGRDVGYIGKSDSLAHRVWSYGYSFAITYANQNRPVNDEMRKALEAKQSVEVWVCTDTKARLPSGRAVCAAAGLEDALIRELQPAWNTLGTRPRSQWRGSSAGDAARKAWATRRAAA
jgi:excinuclease UvrABC nuclease subunit